MPPLLPVQSQIKSISLGLNYLRFVLILSSHLHLGLSNCLFHSGFRFKFCVYISALPCFTCTVHVFLQNVITVPDIRIRICGMLLLYYIKRKRETGVRYGNVKNTRRGRRCKQLLEDLRKQEDTPNRTRKHAPCGKLGLEAAMGLS
jgi:hypothetical protein